LNASSPDTPNPGDAPAVHVPGGLHLQSRFFAQTAGLWRRLGALETAAVGDLIREIQIDRPVYVSSLPRSGTTIVTEMLERHPDVTSHRYSDFPNVWTPYWRNYLLQKTRRETPARTERAHRDRIRVSNDSPEAVEEILWMHFFEGQHDPSGSAVLGPEDRNARFDRFYRDHIRKLLAVRGATRYLAKGNYNLARIRYLLSLFPDARFLVPVRDPVHHVASLMKQHELFQRGSQQDPRVARQLSMAGHFEFGPCRQAVCYGGPDRIAAITDAWRSGREAEGWSLYWTATYRYVLGLWEAHEDVRQACLLFRYEDLCTDSLATIDRILEHCGLDKARYEGIRDHFAGKLSLPDYYQPRFTPSELERIEQNCAEVRDRLYALT
jgi:hypothetical protein